MRRVKSAVWIAVLVVSAMIPSDHVTAQAVDHGNVEFSVMNGLGIVTDNDETATVLMTPVPPVWRLSFWTPSTLTIDLGFSALTAHEDEESVSILNLEGGLGANLAPRDAKTVPFVGGFAGLITLGDDDDSETEFYIGGHLGLRAFIRDYAAIRVQAGYRHLMVEGDDAGIIELVGGLSFFL